jgi:H+/gluconate symporter-like permease
VGEFDFYFTFYGLLLSLSAGTVIIRFADVVGERRGRQIGVLGPLLGLFVLLDITSFWIWAWRARTAFQVNYEYMYFGLAIAVAYFFSASQVFPKETGDWKSLDEYYWKRKRYVLPGIIVANVAVIAHGVAVRGATLDSKFWFEQPFYWVPVVALLFTRKKSIDLALLIELCAFYVGGSLIFRW